MPEPKPPPELNITTLRTAEMLIERHGSEALAFAEAQAARLLAEGKKTSPVDWQAVVAVIRHLLATKGH